MNFCKYCGEQISNDVDYCPYCGKALRSEQHSTPLKNPSQKRTLLWILLGIIGIIIVILAINSTKCKSSGCSNNAIKGKDYCYAHKCSISSCDARSFSMSDYCHFHYSLYNDDSFAQTNYVSSNELKISNVTLRSTSGYTYAEGTITNTSDSDVSFVKIKGTFENSIGTVIDTDWTYAVGSEGLSPGETCKWELSVRKDSSIKKCSVKILDFDY